MEKPTDGPWWWEDWNEDDGPCKNSLVSRPETRPGGRDGMFPDLPNRILYDADDECTPANKALIAAAPKLLAACKLALSAFENRTAIDWNILSDAIAEAEPTTD